MAADRELQKRVLALETLLDLSKSFNLFLEMEDLGSFLLLTLLGQLSFSRGALFVESPDSPGTMTPVATGGIDLDRLSPISLSWERGVGRSLLQAKEALVAIDGPGSDDADTRALCENGFRYASGLVARGRHVGLILFGKRIHEHALSEGDAQALASIAEMAAIAIENSLLYDSLRRSNEELVMKNVRLEEMARLKAEFIQNLGHELRTPMTTIFAHAECLQHPKLDEAVRIEFSQQLLAQAKKLHAMIERLLTLASLSAESMELDDGEVDLHALLLEEAEMFRVEANEKKQTLRVVPPPDQRLAEIDAPCTRQILRYLIENAIKFTPSGGDIAVSGLSSGDEVVVEVRDTGIGIAPHEHKKIFDPFYQVDGSTTREHGGIGIGLTLAKELAERQGGRVEVESALGCGSVFTIHLPANGARPHEAVQAAG
jgi:signal transduction histidine kinase